MSRYSGRTDETGERGSSELRTTLFGEVSVEDARRSSPATERNREPILTVLERVLPSSGLVLEIASGTGEHAVFFAERFPGLRWQPSDSDPENLASISAWIEYSGVANVLRPLELDVTRATWPVGTADVIFNANLIHIAPWSACEGLMRGVERLLRPGGMLVMYGPYRVRGVHTSTSNEAFDASLRARDPSWGVRNLDDVITLARRHGLEHVETVTMPANNLTVIYRRAVD